MISVAVLFDLPQIFKQFPFEFISIAGMQTALGLWRNPAGLCLLEVNAVRKLRTEATSGPTGCHRLFHFGKIGKDRLLCVSVRLLIFVPARLFPHDMREIPRHSLRFLLAVFLSAVILRFPKV